MMRKLPLLFFLLPVAFAQQYIVSTIAGTGRIPFGGTGAPAVNARLIQPYGVAADNAGNIFVSDQYYLQVFRIDPNGIISVYAGTGAPGTGGDKGKANAAQFGLPGFLATDAGGNLYIADPINANVRKVSPDGTITTAATLGGTGVTTDTKGNLYIAGANTIHVLHPDGTSALVAGTGKPGYSGDGNQAINAQLFTPQGMRVDAAGNLFVADFGNNVIRKITPQGVITTIAGNGKAGAGSNGPALSSPMNGPQDLVFDAGGFIYVAEAGQIRQIDKNSVISQIAGGGLSLGDGPAKDAYLIYPYGLTLDSKGNLVVALGDNKQVRRVTPQGTIVTVAGLPPTASLGENVPAVSTPLLNPMGIVADDAGNLLVADWADERIRKISSQGLITTLAGNGLWGRTGDNGNALAANLGGPYNLGMDAAGNLYVSNVGGNNGHTVRKIAPDGTITTFAGGGSGALGAGVTGASIGDGGKPTAATLDFPRGIAADSAGNVYIADHNHDRIRRVDPAGIVTTFAGVGTAGYTGDNGPAANAQLFFPNQVAIDRQGNLYVADSSNNVIRRITPAGIISTVVGTGVAGALGDGGPAVSAQLTNPLAVAVDAAGNLYAGTGGRIRKVDAATGAISTIAGTGTVGFSGDGGPAASAQINGPVNLAVDGSYNVYFTESGNLRVRKLTPQLIAPAGVLNAASLLAGPVAPGEIVAINVSVFDPTQTGAQVLFDGTPAVVISTQPKQITAIVPYAVAGQDNTQLQIVAGAISTNAVAIPVAVAAPGIFTVDASGQGAGMIANEDGSQNSPANPAAHGSMVTISATGEGQTDPGADGQVTVQIGGIDAPVISAGDAPNQSAGYFQVVAQVPDGAPVGDAVPIAVIVGGIASQPGVTISVQ